MNPNRLRSLIGTLPLLTLAIGGAHAQSSVSISGSLDIGMYKGLDGNKQVGTIQRSHIAVAGAEDLGGGLNATFKLAHRLDADTGTSEGAGSKPFWQGESTVGLRGGWGHLRLGRALDAISNNDWAYDPWYNFDRVASPAWNNWHWNYATDRTSNNGGPEYGRLDNGLFYDSPNLGGVTLHLSGSFENSAVPGSGQGNNVGLSLNYGQGPVSLMLARNKNRSGDTLSFVGAKYSVGAWQLMGAYDHSVFNAATDSTAKVLTVGAIYTVGSTAFKAGYGRRDVDGAKTNFIGLGANHALSKRTAVYVSLGRNDPAAAASATAYGVGVTHSF